MKAEIMQVLKTVASNYSFSIADGDTVDVFSRCSPNPKLLKTISKVVQRSNTLLSTVLRLIKGF